MSGWKFDTPPLSVPIAAGVFYRTRGNLTAFVMTALTIPPSDSSTHPTWHGWKGYVVETGAKCAWAFGGDHSPAWEHPLDIVDAVGN